MRILRRHEMTSLLLQKMLLPVTDLLDQNIALLTELDSATGDGDHGVTIGKISKKIRTCVNELSGNEEITGVLDDLSWDLMNINGGSAGPLWGAFFEGMATGAGQECISDDQLIKNILIEGYSNFSVVSKANAGEKTMMDAIYPATEVLRLENGSIKEVANKMASAALAGARDTTNMIAKYGRAKSLKEKSLGHEDPGAVSFSLFYVGIAEGLNE